MRIHRDDFVETRPLHGSAESDFRSLPARKQLVTVGNSQSPRLVTFIGLSVAAFFLALYY
jgi:hypothetical protein